LKKNNKIAMDFIWEGLPKPVREKVGKCSSAKELWDKLHDIYSSPIADSENAKEDADTEQEERCYPRYLGITRRSCLEAHMVLDMEYREQERPEHGPGGPIFFFSASFVLPAVPASITTGLGLCQKGLLLHEVIGLRYHGMCHI
jgi:hypothetical protein